MRREQPQRLVPPPRGLSRRAAFVAVLLLVIAVAVSPFVRAWVQQQSDLAALRADIAEREERVAGLDRDLDRWDDDAYVIAQARERFTYVMPGEVGYVVLDDTPAEQAADDPTAAAAEQAAGDDRGSWFGTLWGSVELAGEELVAPTAP